MATERIAIRQDTACNWETANPTLASGEQGHESDTGRRKIGDGATAWNSLAYMYGTTATKDAGTEPDEVPTNADLGTAATQDMTVLTESEYDALDPPEPETIYLVTEDA